MCFQPLHLKDFHCWNLLDLYNCPQLLQIFSQIEEKDLIGNHIQLKVPFLRNLSVMDCPQWTCFIVGSQLMELLLYNVGNSCQSSKIDVPILNQDYIEVGNHEEVLQVQGEYSFSSKKENAIEGFM
ncbi:hypothetical protein E1A91_D05G421300v1 [Gossypium mustelinum]|uniref:Uncharacterized protein n=1 Tax=Gossypium mustelinum TaxID=34275 RepID=A0A5D2V7K6_GOSMU|nr:hypothetical protein E1A91_D05G421300v1 [Gossypium mustelinum]